MTESLVDRFDIIKKLKAYLLEYDEIFFVAYKASAKDCFWRKSWRRDGKRILLLLEEAERMIQPELEYGPEIRIISSEEYREAEKLYYLYEFSDRVHFLEKKNWYGGLENYVSRGILTEEEALMALQR